MSEWEKRIGLADMHGTVVKVNYAPPDAIDEEPYVSIQVSSGAAILSASATPTALRQLSAALLDAADQVDEAGQAA